MTAVCIVDDREELGDARGPATDSGPGPRAPLPERRFLPEGVPIDLASLERLAIQEALRRVNGNRTHAARLLGISLRTLRNKLRGYREARLASAAGQILPCLIESESDSTSARSSHSDSHHKENAA